MLIIACGVYITCMSKFSVQLSDNWENGRYSCWKLDRKHQKHQLVITDSKTKRIEK